MPTSRDHRSRSRERTPTDDNKNDNNNDNHLEHIIRKVLALALNKFDQNKVDTKEDTRAPNTERAPGERGGDNDLAKLVLSHAVQFGVRRYLKSREKKAKAKAVKSPKPNVKMPRYVGAPAGGPPLPGPLPGPPPGPPDRGIGSASQYYYPPSPQRCYPEDRRQERRERYERRLERERLEQLERMRAIKK
ncbi:hypothetical protein Sste5346_006427 [Sporothrix stenoceras]|uniref:Uncharacterized protein n=1 Tax=Sporothrix stenoceras TaxID=5173 RepID=A0ABR3YZ04_9PEZI